MSLSTPSLFPYNGALENRYKPRPVDNSRYSIASQGNKLKFDNGPRLCFSLYQMAP